MKGAAMQLEPYLFFEGRCDEALEFYRRTLGAKVEGLMRYKDAPKEMPCPASMKPENVMHARVRIGDAYLMASDGRCEGTPRFEGFSLSLTVEDDAGAKRAFDGLSQGGNVVMPLGRTFYATSFGMVADKFGVTWMVVALDPRWVAQSREAGATA